MATLREYFESDFNYLLNASDTFTFQSSTGEVIGVLSRVHLDFNSNTKFISCYIPACSNPLAVCVNIANDIPRFLAIADGVEVAANLPGERPRLSRELQFSGRVFFYSETAIPDAEFEALAVQARPNGVYLHYRGQIFADERSKLEKPFAFISHDSRDKNEIALPLANRLMGLMCPVWYDEFSLNVGDSLRESIEKGLRESKKCILVLTGHFLSNQGWTKREFNSVFTREIIESKNVVLPIWCGVTKQQIYEYSPVLVDKVGVNWNLGIDEVVRKLHRAILAE